MQGFRLPRRQRSLTRQNLSLQSTFPIKLYHPEEDPKKGQISDKNVECFLCLVVSILNSEKEIILHIKKKTNRSSRPEAEVSVV